jgi:hypothetical protein
MKKEERQKIFDKYGGRCAYCGCELQKGWHVDEIDPVVRGFKYRQDENGKRIRGDNGEHLKDAFMKYPERVHIDNQNPACASCNIQKHSQSLEGFRQGISGFVNSLNQYHSIYRFAKRYGLVVETGIEVKFYFEKLNKEQEDNRSVATKPLIEPNDGKQKTIQ